VLQRHFKAIAFPNIPSPYDLVAESYGGSFLKCQVKTCDSVNVINGCRYWRFHTSNKAGAYLETEVDFFALVSLPRRLVFFRAVSDVKKVCRIREDQMTERGEIESLDAVLGQYL